MTVNETQPSLHVSARDVPVPAHLSPEAQAVLAMGLMEVQEDPAPDDLDGWRAAIAARDEAVLPMLADRVTHVAADVEEIDLEGIPVYAVTPHNRAQGDRRVALDLHGGGLVMGGGAVCRAMAIGAADRTRLHTWSVDYRMPPDHPYPTPLDDCLGAYRALLRDHRPEDIIVSGGSAGANLAAALILRARDEGLALPAAAVLTTPELDLTESGDTFHTNLGLDNILTGSLMSANLLYAAGHDLTHPYLSPLFGDFTKGFPPTLLATGTRDLFLSNTVRMHRALRAADVTAELHVLEAAPHGGFLGIAPEDHALQRDISRFVDTHSPR